MRILFVFMAAALLVGCAAKIIEPTAADVQKAGTRFPNATLADLQQGKTIYQNHCGGCHPHKKVSSFTEAQWRTITPKMVAKTNKKFKNVIDARGEEVLLQYLVTMAKSS